MELDVASPRSRLVALLLCFFLGVYNWLEPAPASI